MPTLRYRFVRAVAKILGGKHLMTLKPDALKAELEKRGNEKIAFPAAFTKSCVVERIDGDASLGIKCPCYVLRGKKQPAKEAADAGKKGAILFIHGGGYVEFTSEFHWLFASRLACRTGLPVYFPLYPLLQYAPEQSLEAQFDTVYSVYQAMVKEYGNNIIVAGDSAGADITLTLCHYIKDHKDEVMVSSPMPQKIVLISPADCGEQDSEVVKKMREIEARDVMCGVEYNFSFPEVFHIDTSTSNYFFRSCHGDFKGFPEALIFSGTDDVFYPQIPAFVERLEAAGVKHDFVSGKGMMHDWPIMPIAPECLKALGQIVEFITKPV
ncbi:MAG: alpha/beta hydrolase [Spirochaetaceae bacterium]|jgi:acetyl esterase/lipase|nr:alpha/beta hydrolase [Spirochaetaceae bacterium]